MSGEAIERGRGRSLELFFIDGKPDGMLTATVPFQWTGHVLMTSRNQISQALARKEASRTGVYILLGEGEDGAMAYIGEGEDISDRIRSHVAKKDWWTTAVLITSSEDDLNKAHVRYLESRLIETAQDIGKTILENNNSPTRPGLSEAAQSNMEGFLDNVFMVLPAVRIDIFLKSTRPTKAIGIVKNGLEDDPVFELKTPIASIRAKAVLEGGDFIVQAGSLARPEWVGDTSKKTAYSRLYQELVDQGVLEVSGSHRVFVENYAFNSPSAAGAVINGRSTNGQTAWKHLDSGKTFREWESDNLIRALPTLTLEDLRLEEPRQ